MTIDEKHPQEDLTGRVVGRHRALLSDPTILSWWEARSLRSRLNADQLVRQLGLLLERLKLTPRDVVALAKKDPDRLRDLLVRDAAALKREGRLDSYIHQFSAGLKSYLRFHRVSFDGFPSLSPIKGASLTAERVPTPEELGRVLEKLTPRGRVTALFMAHAGLRPGSLASYQGEAGLTLGDLPELRLGRTPDFVEQPFVVLVPALLSKTRQLYTTFGSAQLGTALLSYLEQRRAGGEQLGPGSAILAPPLLRGAALRSRQEARFSKGFLTTTAAVKEVRDALQSTVPEGVRWRPYVLRAFCSSRLLMAEGGGKISRDLREAILGHDTGVAGRYNVGKTWGVDMLRDARAAYKRAEPYLLTSSAPTESSEAVTRALRLLLAARGVPESKLEGLDLTGKSDEEIVALLKTVGAAVAPATRPEKAVDVTEVPKLLEAGWEFVSPLNGSMAVLRAPAQ
ncbi:MAG: hypothetical protein ACRECR_02700 [Thermoplasmata archaeon]